MSSVELAMKQEYSIKTKLIGIFSDIFVFQKMIINIQYLTEVSTPSQLFLYFIIYFHVTTLKKLHFATM